MITKILIILMPALIAAQAPCSSMWQYVRGSNQIEGLLTVTHNNAYSEHNLKVILSVGSRLSGSYVGEIGLVKDRNSAINDVKYRQSVQYRVKFPVQSPLPKLTEVYSNGQLLCTGPKDVAEYVTSITLNHKLSTASSPAYPQNIQNSNNVPINYNTQNYQNYQSSPNTQNVDNFFNTLGANPPYRPTYAPTQPPIYAPTQPPTYAPTQPPTYAPTQSPAYAPQQRYSSNTRSQSNHECGIPLQDLPDSNALVVNGRPALKGQFPWLAAYYHNGVRENGFICGGSLVSSKAIITAAHCIHSKNDNPKRAEDALFYIGKHYINSLTNERDFIIAPVSKFVVHPEWNSVSDSYDADIAMVILLRTIEITNFIRPICLWTSSNNYYDIIKKFGVVAGYGKTETTATTSDKPYWTALPIVDEGTCLRSHDDFRKITSRRTFCVGSRDGRGPCNGDSGGGLIVKNGGRWYLRGVVSASLFDKELFSCDTRNFAVFTDVAAYSNWIQQYL